MALYVIGDTHLSFGTDKTMDVFGGGWEGYTEKLRRGFAVLGEGDTLVIAGDISWGMRLPESLPDFEFLNSFPGNKILVRGNHDYWWESISKMRTYFETNGLRNFDFLQNSSITYNDIALCGTRGWSFEENAEDMTSEDRKIFLRELGRLELSLQAAGDKEIYVFLHYPPVCRDYFCEEITALFEKYKVSRCYYGHIHGDIGHWSFEGDHKGVSYALVAADRLEFTPKLIG
ncbi:MAG: metallophosphoesterase [Oscillospiraceae bacterium]|jgi:predicted phosphohydrolase|nr:metallophosphoesterase [Oscillospiraceae bacterium]